MIGEKGETENERYIQDQFTVIFCLLCFIQPLVKLYLWNCVVRTWASGS